VNDDEKLFFSLKGVDISDDDALEAFAQQVWEQASAAFTQVPETTKETTDNRHDNDLSTTGESDE
jgi:hypothetical protein